MIQPSHILLKHSMYSLTSMLQKMAFLCLTAILHAGQNPKVTDKEVDIARTKYRQISKSTP